MADSVLEILIRFGLDAEKAKEAEQIIRQTTSETREAGQATEEMGEKEEEASKFTELLHHNHRALHQILHMLGRETVPELGHALTGALYGPIGIVIALGAAFEFFKKRAEEATEKMKELRSVSEGFAETTSSINEANQAISEYNDKLEHLTTVEERRATAIKNQVEYQKALLEAEGKVGKAKTEADTTDIDAAVANKRLTPAQGAARKATAEEEQREKEALLEAQKAAIESRTLTDALFNAKTSIDGLKSKYDEAQKAADTEKQLKDEAAGRQKDLQDKIAEKTEELNKKDKYISDKDAGNIRYGVGTYTLFGMSFEALKASIPELSAQLTGLKNDLAKQTGIVSKGDSDKAELERIKKSYEDAKKIIETFPDKIAAASKIAGASEKGTSGANEEIARKAFIDLLNSVKDTFIAGTLNQHGKIMEGLTAGTLENVMEIQEKVRNHENLTKEETKLLKQFDVFYARHEAWNDNIGQVLNKLMSTANSSVDKMKALSSDIDTMQKRVDTIERHQ